MLILDPVPKSSVQSLLALSNVCYIGLTKSPLFRFGVSPNKLFDYLYSGKPIIYAIEAANDIVAEANCGISIKSENAGEIVNAVLTLYGKTPEELAEMGKRGHEYVIKNHSYSELAKKYLEILK